MKATYQPDSASSSTWTSPTNALGVSPDGSAAKNSSGTGLIILKMASFEIPIGYQPVGFVVRGTAGTGLNPVITTFGVGYQQELASANISTNGRTTDIGLGDQTTYVAASNTGSGAIPTVYP